MSFISACARGDLPVCFAFLAIWFQFPDNPFFHLPLTYMWVWLTAGTIQSFWQLYRGPPSAAFWTTGWDWWRILNLNSIITDSIPLLLLHLDITYRIPGFSTARVWLLKWSVWVLPPQRVTSIEGDLFLCLVPYLGGRQSGDWFSPTLYPFPMCFLSTRHAFSCVLQSGSCQGRLLGDALSSTKSAQLGGQVYPPQTAGLILFVFLLFLLIAGTWIKVNIIDKGAPADTLYGFFNIHLVLPESGKRQRAPEVPCYLRNVGVKLKGTIATSASDRLLPGLA